MNVDAVDWEALFNLWAQTPGQTEREKMENAERAIKKAIDASESLSQRDIRVFAQGSYRSRTNVRQDSDVDVCVLCTDTFYFELPDGYTREQFELNSPATYHDDEYRKHVEVALRSYFGTASVQAGSKAWDIHGNTYRVDADVVACFEYRFYHEDRSFRKGTAVLPRSGSYILNYPEQNYENCKSRNKATNHRFRAAIRILKNLSNAMAQHGVVFQQLPSFLIECLVWNVPNEGFNNETLTADIRWILGHLCNETRSDDTCKDWTEINGYKYLFHSSQKWSRGEVNASLNAMWRFVGFK